MFNKKLIMLSLFIVSLLAISAVNATENATSNMISIEETDNLINSENVDLKIESEDYENDFDLKTSENTNLSDEILAENQENPITEYKSGSKGHIESKDAEITYKKQIGYKIRLVGENVNNQEVSFEVWEVYNGGKRTLDDFDTYSDSNGYATLKANLEWGYYYIVTSTWDHGSAQNYLLVKPNGYRGLHFQVDNVNHEVTYGWSGIFNGYLKIYKGSKLIKKITLKSKENDYKNYWFNWGCYNIKKFKDGKYTAKIVNSKGKVVLKKAFNVCSKESSSIKVKSFSTKIGKKHTIKAFVENSYGDKIKKGVVKFKINGKKYQAKIRKGVAKVTIKSPNKAKTYKCKAIFLGNKKNKKSTTTFKVKVKGPKVKKVTKKTSKYKIITTSANWHWTTKHSGKFKVKTKIWDMTAGFRAPYKYIDTTLYKNGKQVYPTKYLVKYKINGRWTGWADYGTTSTAHHRYMVPDSASVGQIKVKVNKNVNSFI